MKKNKQQDKLFDSIKSLIEEAKSQIVRNVNSTMVITYFQIGKITVEDEQNGNDRADYSKRVLHHLSEKLTKTYGKGYSPTNLEYIRKFYNTRISQPAVGKSSKTSKPDIPQSLIEEFKTPLSLSRTHYIQLLKIDDDIERGFYEIEAVQGNWSVRELQRQYNSSHYERVALSRDKKKVKELGKKGQTIEKAIDALKHHTVLEFLDLHKDQSYTESDLENAIIYRLEHFMMILSKGFLFVAWQKRISFEGDSFYIDLVFYSRLLCYYVPLDLKIGKLTHENIGQMQMYVNYYDRKLKLQEENATINIILFKEANKAVVEFTLPENNKTIFAREFKRYLPSKPELKTA